MNNNFKTVLICTALSSILIGCGTQTTQDETNKNHTKPLVLKLHAFKDASLDEIGKTKINAQKIADFNYEKSIEDMKKKFNTEDIKDNYIRGFDYKNNKLAVASVYNNMLVVFDEKGDFNASNVAALNGAGDKKNGISVDGVTSASENWLNQVSFDNTAKYIYALVKPKNFGWFLPYDNADHASSGIYKLKLGANNSVKIDNDTPFVNHNFYHFDLFNNGDILAHDNENGDFYIFDENLTQKNKYHIENSYRYDMKNDKLVVLVKDQKTKQGFIGEYDAKSGRKLANQTQYNHTSDANSLFELTNDGTKLLSYYDDAKLSLVCAYDVATFSKKCENFGKNYKKSIGAISPDGKYLALNLGIYNNSTSIINIQNTPFLAYEIPSLKESMAVKFLDNNTLVFSQEDRKIKKYKINDISSTYNIDEKFKEVEDNIFKIVSKNINNILIYEQRRKGKKSIIADVKFPLNINGVNIEWVLPGEFKEVLDEHANVLKVPKNKISGIVSAKLYLLKNSKIIKQSELNTTMSFVPKK